MTLRRIFIFSIIILTTACRNRIETGQTLSNADISFIQSLKLLDTSEKIIQFYSEYKKKNAGNFFTNKRMATYWIDPHNKSKDNVSFAFYPDIKSVDTIYYAGLTYCPYLLVTKNDNTQFKVLVEGSRQELKTFFETAIVEWRRHKN
jgi:hypothetical protein